MTTRVKKSVCQFPDKRFFFSFENRMRIKLKRADVRISNSSRAALVWNQIEGRAQAGAGLIENAVVSRIDGGWAGQKRMRHRLTAVESQRSEKHLRRIADEIIFACRAERSRQMEKNTLKRGLWAGIYAEVKAFLLLLRTIL